MKKHCEGSVSCYDTTQPRKITLLTSKFHIEHMLLMTLLKVFDFYFAIVLVSLVKPLYNFCSSSMCEEKMSKMIQSKLIIMIWCKNKTITFSRKFIFIAVEPPISDQKECLKCRIGVCLWEVSAGLRDVSILKWGFDCNMFIATVKPG